MNWSAVGTLLAVIALAFSIGNWYSQNKISSEKMLKRIAVLEKSSADPVPQSRYPSLTVTSRGGANLRVSGGQQIITLGRHPACFLTRSNENGTDNSGCYVDLEENIWKLTVTNALCEAVCISLNDS